jgi:hypothetical protein
VWYFIKIFKRRGSIGTVHSRVMPSRDCVPIFLRNMADLTRLIIIIARPATITIAPKEETIFSHETDQHSRNTSLAYLLCPDKTSGCKGSGILRKMLSSLYLPIRVIFPSEHFGKPVMYGSHKGKACAPEYNKMEMCNDKMCIMEMDICCQGTKGQSAEPADHKYKNK